MGINELKSLTESDAKDRYDRLIDNAKQQSYIDEGTYYEKHHIIPKSLGGKNDADNIVKLTAKDHILAHILLTIVYPDNSDLLFAAMSMTLGCSKFTSGREEAILEIDLEIVAELREKYGRSRVGMKFSDEHRKHISEAKMGIKLPKFTEEHKEKISKALKGRKYSEETITKMSLAAKGRKHTQETRNKMSKTRKGMKFSEEHNKKISDSLKNSSNLFRKMVISPEGIIYKSVIDAANGAGVSKQTMNRWLKNKSKRTGKGWNYYIQDDTLN